MTKLIFAFSDNGGIPDRLTVEIMSRQAWNECGELVEGFEGYPAEAAVLVRAIGALDLMEITMTNYDLLTTKTKDEVIIVAIFAATGHVFMTLLMLGLMWLSSKNDRKKAAAEKPELWWDWDDVQFPRLIAEMVAVGAPSQKQILELGDVMDLDSHEVDELLDRAQVRWEELKQEEVTDAKTYR